MTPTYLRALQAATLSLCVSLASAQALTPQQLAAACTAVKADRLVFTPLPRKAHQ